MLKLPQKDNKKLNILEIEISWLIEKIYIYDISFFRVVQNIFGNQSSHYLLDILFDFIF